MFLYTKKSCFFIVLFFSILLVSYFVVGQFSVGLILGNVHFNLSGSVQLNGSVQVNGSNVSIRIPILYYNTGLYNVSIEKPTGWYNGSNWYVVEGIQTKGVISNATHLNWTANLSSSNAFLLFNVPPPYLINATIMQSTPLYEINFTVTSLNHLLNISANLTINSSINGSNNTYDAYALFWYDGLNWTNMTEIFHLNVLNNIASFYGFNISDQYFKFQGYCIPDWQCGSWSSCYYGTQTRSCIDINNCDTTAGMPDLTQSCEMPIIPSGGGGGKPRIEEINKEFDVSPKIIRLRLKENELAKKLIRIENKGEIRQKFRVSSKYNYIFFENNTVFIDKEEYMDFEVTISAQDLEPDSYFAKIIVSNGETEKEILVILEVESGIKVINIHLDISPEYTLVKPGSLVIGTVTIYNLFKDPSDVFLNYYIKNLDGDILIHKQEEVHVEHQLSFDKKFQLPDDIEDGSYILSVKGQVQDYVSVSSGLIQVITEMPVKYIEKPIQVEVMENKLIPILVTIFIIILIILVISRIEYNLAARRKLTPSLEPRKDITKRIKEKEQELKQRIRKEKIKRSQEELLKKQAKKEAKTKEHLLRDKEIKLNDVRKTKEIELLRLKQEIGEEVIKKRIRLEKQALKLKNKEEKLRGKREKLLELKKKHEEKRKALLEKQREDEIEKIRREAELERMKLQKQKEKLKEKAEKERLRIEKEKFMEQQRLKKQKQLEKERKQKLELRKQHYLNRKEKMHNFFHAIGFYKTEEERRQLQLLKQKGKEEKLGREKEKLIESKRRKEEKRKARLQRKIEIEKLHEKQKLERLRLKREKERIKHEQLLEKQHRKEQDLLEKQRREKGRLTEFKKDRDEKRRAKLQKQIELEKLKEKQELEKLRLQRQREKARLLQEKQKLQEKKILLEQLEKRKMQRKAMREKHRSKRKKVMHDFMYSIGFYKTKGERKQERLQKQIDVQLEMRKLEERRNAWLAKQKEIELEKLKEEENLEILRLSRQKKEEEIIEKKEELREQRKEEKPKRFKLFKIPQPPEKVEIPQIPKREDTLTVDLLNTLIDRAYQNLGNNDLNDAYKNYLEIRNIYHRLSPDLRKQVAHKCIELHDILMARFSAQK